MVGNAKTVNRGENVKRVPSTPNASGTVQTAENWAKTAENWAETRKRLTGNVQEFLPWQKNGPLCAMAAVYLSFTAEGQGSWERVSFPGIVGGGCVPVPPSG